MCGRYSLQTSKDELTQRYLAYFESFNLIEDYNKIFSENNLFPGQNLPVIINLKEKNVIKFMTWGLSPSFDRDNKFKIINARCETLEQKPAFKNLLQHNRCLIPVTSFYEWDDKKGIHQFKSQNSKIFSLAGLYSIGNNDNQPAVSYTIITIPPSTIVSTIHDRMPAILNSEDEAVWLDENVNWENAKKYLIPNNNLSHERI